MILIKKEILYEFHSIDAKPPISIPITLQNNYNEFINIAWKGFKETLEEDYGFESALEWLLDANISISFESKYINAATCLETLLDVYHSKQKTEYLLTNNIWKKFSSHIRKTSSDFLFTKEIDPITINLIKEKVPELRRRSARNKAEKLIENSEIDFSDIKITIDQIIKVRDKITHTGKVKFEQILDPIEVYNGLMRMLIKLFLSILNYKGTYFDPWIEKVIEIK